MDRAGIGIALAAAVLWAALALAWLIAVTPDESFSALVREDLEDARQRASVLCPPLTLCALLATLGVIASQELVSRRLIWAVGPEVLLTVAAATPLMFHVEHRPLPRILARILPGAKQIACMHLTLAAIAGCLLAFSFTAQPASWLALVAGGAMIALIIAACALALVARHTGSPPHVGVLFMWWRRWLRWASLGGLLALGVLAYITPHSGTRRLVLAAIVAAAGALVLAITGQAIIGRSLRKALGIAPIWSLPDRTVRARMEKIAAICRRAGIILCGNMMLAFLLAASLLAFAIARQPWQPLVGGSAPSQRLTATPAFLAANVPSGTAQPSATPAATSLTQSAGGVTVTLVLPSPSVGQIPARLAVRGSRAQIIPNAALSVVAAPALLSQQGIAVAAVPDPHGPAGDFVATLPLTQPGMWQVVVVVTAPGDNLAASVVFTLDVSS
jgi:hypothetical protein